MRPVRSKILLVTYRRSKPRYKRVTYHLKRIKVGMHKRRLLILFIKHTHNNDTYSSN